MELISKQEAIEQGLKYYFTGKFCKHGHIDKRQVINSMCYKCAKDHRTKIAKKYYKKYYLDTKDKRYALNKIYRNKNWLSLAFKSMLSRARTRAQRFSREFSLKLEDLILSEKCPCCGVKMRFSNKVGGEKFSPSLDRIDSTKGYTKDNVAIICKWCNGLKRDASLEQLENLIKYVKNNAKVQNWLDRKNGTKPTSTL